MSTIPFSRPWSARHVGQAGSEVALTAEPAERDALAREFGLASIDRLEARLRMEGRPDRVRVTGRVTADVVQTCVVTLEPFPARVDAAVDVTFRERSDKEARWEEERAVSEVEADLDAPDDLVDGTIDLGQVASEFLALALDPYPRKPGAELETDRAGEVETSPFAALKGLAGRE